MHGLMQAAMQLWFLCLLLCKAPLKETMQCPRTGCTVSEKGLEDSLVN